MKTVIVLISLLCSILEIKSQPNSALDLSITCQFRQAKPKEIFDEISRQSGLIFSYSKLDEGKLMDLSVKDKKVREVLPILEEELNASLMVKGKYIIVKSNNANKDFLISGTLWDNNNDVPLSNASVYVKSLKKVTTTDEQGKFNLKLPQQSKMVKINFAKENFNDTSLIVMANKNQSLNIFLNTYSKTTIAEIEALKPKSNMMVVKDSTKIKMPSLNNVIWAEIEEKNINLRNIRDTFFSNFSFSLFPPVSTNKLLSFNTRNAVAINLIGGHSKGVDIFELGGVFNIDRGDARYLQIAGVSNIVYGNTDGIQIGGVFNTVRKNMRGIQMSGTFNYVDSTTTGLQASGCYQYTNRLHGLQIAGAFNQANYVKGMQISGLINQADTLTGVQLGVINISNHLKGGLPIGLFNYVKDGYHKLELSYDDLGFYNLGFRSGINQLHMHYRFGARNEGNKTILNGTIGLAASLKLTKGLYFEMDANTGNFHDLDNLEDYSFNMKNQLLLGFSIQPLKKIGLRFGATLNHFWYDNSNATNRDIVSLMNKPFFTESGNGKEHKMWLGYQVSLLLF